MSIKRRGFLQMLFGAPAAAALPASAFPKKLIEPAPSVSAEGPVITETQTHASVQSNSLYGEHWGETMMIQGELSKQRFVVPR